MYVLYAHLCIIATVALVGLGAFISKLHAICMYYVRLCACVCACVYVCVRCVCTYLCMYDLRACMYVCIRMYACMVCVCVYVYA